MVLTDIQKGEFVTITGIKPCDFREKLMEMGCVPGTKVSLNVKAPLGDPVAYNMGGYCLCMRKSEAALIEVEPVSKNG
jgi:ferrous iron transport protein A